MDKGVSRRSWTKIEETYLIDIMEELVKRGYLRENGQFKAGTSLKIEHMLRKVCPESNLRVNPHIESKMRRLRRTHGIVYDMLKRSGFWWNDVKKCVEVDSDDIWQSYVQVYKEAKGWRNKHFPLYERLANIYGNVSMTGLGAQMPADMVNGLNREEEVDQDVWVNEDDAISISVRQASSNSNSQQFQPTSRKRKRSKSSSDRLAETFAGLGQLVDQTYQCIEKVSERVFGSKDDPSNVSKEIAKLGLSIDDEMDALVIIIDKPNYVNLFKSLSKEKKASFVAKLLRDRDRDRDSHRGHV